MLRLFDHGNLEEKRIVADLRRIGCEVHEVDPSTGKQFAVEACRGHMRGHMDAAVKGLPEAPTKWHVAEFKTHNDKSFKELTEKGVIASKPMHFVQMNTYAGLTGMDHMVYVAVNKNTDDIHVERLPFDVQKFRADIERAERIIFAEEAPLRISDKPDWYQCKMCDAYSQCHGTDAPAVTCRTCCHSTPVDNGLWQCEKHSKSCETPCADHLHRPDLLSQFAEFVEFDGACMVYKNKLTGNSFKNGVGALSSAEITAATDKRILGHSDPTFDALRSMGAEIVG
jgi:hypothetical protein